MTRTLLPGSALFVFSLAFACICDVPGNDTSDSASSTSTASPNGNESGSVTSAAEGSATDSSTSMTGTTSTSGTSDAGASTDGGCSFLDCPDLIVCGPNCDNWVQDCSEGQKCSAYMSAGGGGAWDALWCVEVTGTDQPGEPCTAESVAEGRDSCIKGAMCWGVDEEGVGTCVALCTGNPRDPICPDTTTCRVLNDGVLNLCVPSCNPLVPDCLFQGEVCYAFDPTSTVCAPEPSTVNQVNGPCTFINECDEGLLCAEAALVGAGCEPGATGCCTPFCALPDGACPNPDQQCVQYFDAMNPPFAGAENVGICALPG